MLGPLLELIRIRNMDFFCHRQLSFTQSCQKISITGSQNTIFRAKSTHGANKKKSQMLALKMFQNLWRIKKLIKKKANDWSSKCFFSRLQEVQRIYMKGQNNGSQNEFISPRRTKMLLTKSKLINKMLKTIFKLQGVDSLIKITSKCWF